MANGLQSKIGLCPNKHFSIILAKKKTGVVARLFRLMGTKFDLNVVY